MDLHLGTTVEVRIVWCSALSVVEQSYTKNPTEEDILNVERYFEDGAKSFENKKCNWRVHLCQLLMELRMIN